MNQYTYQDTTSLVKWLKYSMVIWMITVILMLLTEFVYTTVIYHTNTSSYAEGGYMLRYDGPSIWELIVVTFFPIMKVLVSITWIVFFLMWVYRSHANNWSFRLRGLAYPPSMAVAWFVIPMANIFMPFMVLGELFKASDPEADVPGSTLTWHYSGVPSMIGTWWFGMLLFVPLTFFPVFNGWLFASLDGLFVRMLELVFFSIMCTLMFIIWKEAKENQERQEKKYFLMYPRDQRGQMGDFVPPVPPVPQA